MEDQYQDIVNSAITWISSTYKEEGLMGLIVYFLAGGIVFGIPAVIYILCAAQQAKSMKGNDEKSI